MTTKDKFEIQSPGSLQGVSRRALVKAGDKHCRANQRLRLQTQVTF